MMRAFTIALFSMVAASAFAVDHLDISDAPATGRWDYDSPEITFTTHPLPSLESMGVFIPDLVSSDYVRGICDAARMSNPAKLSPQIVTFWADEPATFACGAIK